MIDKTKQFARVTLKGTEKLELIGSFATMLGSGISILEMVKTLAEDTKGGQRLILDEMRDDLSQGKRIYVTFAKFPRVFDHVSVNVIKASEEAGTLDVALRDLRTTLQKDMEFSDKIRSALMYPAFIIVVFIGILGMILTFVIPKISVVFSQLNVPLPLPTRIMIFLSDVVVKHTIWFGGGVLVLGGLVYYLLSYKRRQVLDILFRLPIISTLVMQIDVTNFARNLSVLLSSGLPITQTLELVAEVVIRRRMATLLLTARNMVLAGRPLSEGFRSDRGAVPNIVIKLVEAGEKTGSLDRSLQEIAEYFDYKVTYTLKSLTALLEPVMLVLVGGVVGGMMLAIIAPVYGLISQIGGR
ncbi:MAG: Type II secretion system F domain protein [Microgenomates group bacterium GW2011_GWA2_46_7]|nr:MAG: Type II secretion system F domain protein [Microgenomates group bacterium GW2011_GWA2_46_7]